jgi:hypothetical protein
VQIRSNYGYSIDLTEIMKEFFRDDVMQPAPNQKCRQQNFGIKSLLKKLNLTPPPEPSL